MIDDMKATALEAGEFMRGAQAHTASTDKSNTKDFVTVADIKSQDILRAGLQKAFPDSVILSEEDSETARQAMYSPGFTGFVLDPIDGTYNFKRNMQESAISIGYIEAGKPTAGIIYDPYKDEMYQTEVGKGALCNGERIRVSQEAELAGASVATSNSYDDAAMVRNLRRHVAIYEHTGVMPWTSCPGSGVLIMAWVACGRLDVYHHNGLKPWDNAAGFLLVREAGGTVHNLQGRETEFTSADVLMGNAKLVAELESTFAGIDLELLH